MSYTFLSSKKLADLHTAAKMIETEGVEAFHRASTIVGPDVAFALALMFTRSSFNPTKTFPVDPEITAKANKHLVDEHLVDFVG